MLDLKYFRENILELSLEEFSNLLGLPPELIEQYEGDKNLSNHEDFINFLTQKTDYLREELLNFNSELDETNYNFIPSNNYNDVKRFKKEVSIFKNNIDNLNFDDDISVPIKNILDSLEISIKKPSISFLGNSDVGKSSMINQILGKEISPAKLRPTTSALIKIIHINDRPKNFTETVYALSELSFGKNDISNIVKDKGGYNLIEKYGVHTDVKNNIKEIIVYVDSPILEMCEIWDLPGLASAANNEDDRLTNECIKRSDIIFFLSSIDAFLDNHESITLKTVLSLLKNKNQNTINNKVYSYDNLFIIATKVDRQVKQIPHTNRYKLNSSEIDRAMKEGIKDALFKLALKNNDDLNKRVYAFSIQTDLEQLNDYRNRIYLDLDTLLTSYKKQNIELSLMDKKKWLNSFLDDKSNIINKSVNSYNSLKERVEKLDNENYRNFIKEQNDMIMKFYDSLVEKYKNKSEKDVINYFKATINKNSLLKQIDDNDIKKDKKSLEAFCEFISNKISGDIESIIKKYSDEFSIEFKAKLDTISLKDMPEFNVINGLLNGINNVIRDKDMIAGAAGIAGATATLGALGVLAASAGNLGGYILVTQTIGILADLGIGFSWLGGTSGAVALTSLIGGPIVWGALIAGLIGFGIFSIISHSSWKDKIAEKIIKCIKKEDVENKIIKNINEYWENTQKCKPKDFIVDEYEYNINQLKKQLKNINKYNDEYKEDFNKYKPYILNTFEKIINLLKLK